MSNIPLVGDDVLATRTTFDGLRKAIGMVPNLYRVLGNSPAALTGTLGLTGALAKGVLPAALREQLAIAVAEQNGCGYCLSAHAMLGAGAGLSEGDIDAARGGHATDVRDTAALGFARAVLATQGRVAPGDLAAVRAAGWDDAAVVEIIAHVALNLLTNSINNVADTPIDFPVRALRQAA